MRILLASGRYRQRRQPFNILNCNIRCFLHKKNELQIIVEANDIHLIMIQESWLDQSIENVVLPNYITIGRRDRSSDPNRGGVISFVRNDVKNIIFMNNSENAERIWMLVYRDSGSIAFCNWYLPPSDDIDAIETLQQEIDDMSQYADFIAIIGDLNIHHAIWLRHSRGNTNRGYNLKEICDRN